MLASQERSQLQMQMGQEVIYLLLASSMLGCIVLAAYVLLNMRSGPGLQEEVARLRGALAAAEAKAGGPDLQKEIGRLKRALAAAEGKAAGLEDQIKAARLNDKPPIILLPEAEGYTFETGSARISPSFAEGIKTKIIQIIAAAEAYQATIIEVIGHTDGVSVGPNLRVKANFDLAASDFLDGLKADPPIPFDNAGLGLARAIATAKALREAGLPERYQILPLSAANLISLADKYSPAPPKGGEQSRRRIEIRLRQPRG